MYDLIIIGGGPAGITAGIYAARKKLKTLLITKEWGGQMVKTNYIENWPGIKATTGPELIKKMTEHLKEFEIETKEGKEVISLDKKKDVFIVRDNDQKYEAGSVIIATGKVPRSLNIPGEEKFKGKGVSFCTICDAPMFKNKKVAVIGGGNVGLESALDLTKYTNQVYVLRFLRETKGDLVLKDRLEKSNKVKFFTNVSVKEIKGDKFVKSLIYEDRDTGEDSELKIDGIFIAIGMVSKAGFVEKLVDYDKFGEIKIDKKAETKTKGLFAAGDITDGKFEQIVIAAGEGARAALAAYSFLQKK